jgi:uncharacterized protein (DUF1697 family)
VPRLIVLLRGVNLVSHNRVSMPELRVALADAGLEDVKTYLQSGNVVVGTDLEPPSLARAVAQVVSGRFGIDIGVVVRTHDELADVVARSPLARLATDPKRYQVTFLDGEPDAGALRALEAAARGGERLVHSGRELYTWHPDGIGRSKLGRLLTGKSLGVTATTRNWTTVTALHELAQE